MRHETAAGVTAMEKAPGEHMRREAAEAASTFSAAASCDVSDLIAPLGLAQKTAFFTVARGSSDAAALVLAYEAMRVLGRPVTSLPPSIFSVGDGVALDQTGVFVVSQSGASDDLVLAAKGARDRGASVLAITNRPGSRVETASDATVPIGAGTERAVPATKTVTGAIGAGLSVISALSSDYRARLNDAPRHVGLRPGLGAKLTASLLRARHVYVIGRDTGFGAAHEIALKIKECCALHAEAYSASEVLHGPLQLATNPLFVLMLDTGLERVRPSLDTAEDRLTRAGCDVLRIRPSNAGFSATTPGAAAALILAALYPAILDAALALGFDPDTPATLSKVTQTT